MGVHVGGLRGGVQPEVLAPPQQDVQVVMEVVMQSTAGSCMDKTPAAGLSLT